MTVDMEIMLNLHLYVCFLLCMMLGASSLTTITTNPSSSTCLTTGITNLLVEIKFEKQTTTQCTWIYGGTLETFQFYISGLGGGCQADGTGGGDTITCAEETIDGIDHITTNLTIGGPLAAGTLNLALDCISSTAADVVTPSTSRNITSCSVNTTSYLGVTAACGSACEYNVAATLSCAAGFTGSDVATTCGADCSFVDDATCEGSYIDAGNPTTTDAILRQPKQTNNVDITPGGKVASPAVCLLGGEIAAIVICTFICVGLMVGVHVLNARGSFKNKNTPALWYFLGFACGFLMVTIFSATYYTNQICDSQHTYVISSLTSGQAIAIGVILDLLLIAAFVAGFCHICKWACFKKAGLKERIEGKL
ncbi:uncharacterized protein LOC143446592 isoform X3 [Clavelina lepadiformis]|uniref:uncharacterized protein LOC143446592 isoform X3 n=1 Tax=Clavelina lepadiformis TaxID=159417 RepID=UPI004041666F